ncbi:MAG: homocysteine S-methyltransferase family protein [Enhygromyxa sp.]
MRAPIILLDGAMATQLAARGFELSEPLFAARALLDAPELVEAIHFDYLLAGAQVLTTNSFGLHGSTLARAGIGEQQGALARRAGEILEQVRRRAFAHDRKLARFRIAGSIPPRPASEWVAPSPLAQAEYRCFAEHLADAGVDLILLETFTTIAEARLALAGLAGLELPIWLSVVAGAPQPPSRRPDGSRLIGGEPLAELAALADRVDALLINCTQIDAVPAALDALLVATEAHPALPIGLSPHFGKRRHDGVWIERIVESEVFAEQMQAWLHSERPGRARINLAGACCGSQPDDIAALRRRLQPDEAERERAWTRLAELLP